MRAVIFADGDEGDQAYLVRVRRALAPGDLYVAADGGARLAVRLDIVPHAVLGDFDSLEDEEVARLAAAGVDVRRFPADKDKSDLELAVDYAAERGANAMLLVGVTGTRLDHSLANLLLAARWAEQGVDVTVLTPWAAVYPVVRRRDAPAAPGAVVSLIPLTDTVRGVTTRGLRFALRQATLRRGSTFSISNQAVDRTVGVDLREGSLFLIVEQAQGEA